jgi:hypothetical protein
MEELEYFHITCKEYTVGEILTLTHTTYYHLNAVANGLEWIDNYLDSLKPDIAPSRRRTFYAFGNLQHCLSFFNNRRCEKGNKRIYKVKMANPYAAPMCLTDGLKNNGQDHESNHLIAEEYWNPKNNWKVLEYLSEKMQIMEDVTGSIVGIPQFGNFLYGEDLSQRKKLFNC